MILLETERLLLRNLSPEDAQVMFDYRNNEVCARYQRGQTKDYEGIVQLIDRRAGDQLSADAPCLAAVALKTTGEMVGEIVVIPSEHTFSLGYTFSYRHHRKGYAFEAVSALTETLHERYPDWSSFASPSRKTCPAWRCCASWVTGSWGTCPPRHPTYSENGSRPPRSRRSPGPYAGSSNPLRPRHGRE